MKVHIGCPSHWTNVCVTAYLIQFELVSYTPVGSCFCLSVSPFSHTLISLTPRFSLRHLTHLSRTFSLCHSLSTISTPSAPFALFSYRSFHPSLHNSVSQQRHDWKINIIVMWTLATAISFMENTQCGKIAPQRHTFNPISTEYHFHHCKARNICGKWFHITHVCILSIFLWLWEYYLYGKCIIISVANITTPNHQYVVHFTSTVKWFILWALVAVNF